MLSRAISNYIDHRRAEDFKRGITFLRQRRRSEYRPVPQGRAYQEQLGTSRGIRALELYRNLLVFGAGSSNIPADCALHTSDYMVRSQQRIDEFYHVSWRGSAETSTCMCPDGMGHYVCKHILAVYWFRSDQLYHRPSERHYAKSELLFRRHIEWDYPLHVAIVQQKLIYFRDLKNTKGTRTFKSKLSERAYRIELMTGMKIHKEMPINAPDYHLPENLPDVVAHDETDKLRARYSSSTPAMQLSILPSEIELASK